MTGPSTPRVSARAIEQSGKRNVLANWTAFVSSVAITFFLSPFVVHSLGDTAYGIWVLLGSIVGYMGLLDLGVRSAVMRYVARYHAIGRDQDASSLASAAMVVFGAAGILAVAVSLVVALFVSRLFNVPDELVTEARIVLVLGGINVAIALISGVHGGVLSALQRFDLSSGLEIVLLLGRALAVVLLLTSGYGLVALSVVQLSCSVVQFIAQVLMDRHLYPELKIGWQGWGRTQITEIFSFSVFTSVLHLSRALILTVDPIVIGAFLPVSAITFFAIGGTLTDYARSIANGISQTVTPRASAMDVRGDHDQLREVVLGAAATSTLVILPITVTFLTRGASFIELWMGPSYAERSGAVLSILAAALCFSAGCQVITSTLIGKNQHRKLVPFALAEAGANLALSMVLVRPFGILGVALGTMIPSMVMSWIVYPHLAQRYVGIRRGVFFEMVWMRPALAIIPFVGGSAAIERLWPASNLAVYFLQIAATLPLALVGIWYIGLTARQRESCRPILRRILPIASAR